MAQHILDAFYVRTAGNGYGCRCMPEVMGSCIRPVNAGGNLFEVLVECGDCIVPTRFVRKNKIVWVIPRRSCRQTVFQLPYSLRLEVFKGNGRRLNRPGLAALSGRGYVILSALILLFLELLADGDLALLEINLLPRQS